MIEYKLTQRDQIVALVIRGAIEMHKERRNAADKQHTQVLPSGFLHRNSNETASSTRDTSNV